ncbi:MAG: Gfo/Idh/MocA family oxidoreductase [Candidatus Latescibacteria bacterium]|nr:Gfo/Idh/MocA family oxidoreductase [Candidatus Latescibacterota bacterium]
MIGSIPRPVGIAVLGLGGFGTYITQSIIDCAATIIVGGFDQEQERMRSYSARFSCRGFCSLDEVFQTPEVEAVFIAGPNGVHREHAVQAAKHGVHVFCTKPIANTVDDGLTMVKICRDHGVVFLMDNPPPQWEGVIQAMKDLILRGEIGNVSMVEAHVSSPLGLQLGPGQWRWYVEQCPSGSLHQLGIYQANTLHYLFGPARRVSAFFNQLHVMAEIPDVTATIIEFESGVLGYLGSSYAVGASPYYIQIHGTKGSLSLDQKGLFIQRDGTPQEVIGPKQEDNDLTYSRLLTLFARYIREGGYEAVDVMEAVRALAIVDGAVQSVKLCRPVVLREIFPDLYS